MSSYKLAVGSWQWAVFFARDRDAYCTFRIRLIRMALTGRWQQPVQQVEQYKANRETLMPKEEVTRSSVKRQDWEQKDWLECQEEFQKKKKKEEEREKKDEDDRNTINLVARRFRDAFGKEAAAKAAREEVGWFVMQEAVAKAAREEEEEMKKKEELEKKAAKKKAAKKKAAKKK